VFFSRSGFPVFFFLVPLGIASYRFGIRTAWACYALAAALNFVITLGIVLILRAPPGGLWDFLYFALLTGIFTWITAPPGIPASTGERAGFIFRLSGTLRLAAGSAACTLLLIGTFSRLLEEPVFYDAIKRQIETVLSFYRPGGADVVQSALLESLTPELVLEFLNSVIVRGGGLASSFLIFLVSRQMSIALSRLFGGRYRGMPLRSFHADIRFIWVLSVSLFMVIAMRVLKWTVPEIILWNILTLCAILYLAQGLGILQHFAAAPGTPPFLRLALSILFFILMFSPGINAAVLGLVTLLGIAETWVSFRTPKTDGPSPTPGE
jgi:hypothetical protein